VKSCPHCGTTLKETDLKAEKMRYLCPACAPEFVKDAAFDDYDGPYDSGF
jgi:transposase-like protein